MKHKRENIIISVFEMEKLVSIQHFKQKQYLDIVKENLLKSTIKMNI